MNHTIVKRWTCSQTKEMFDWCRENKIPVNFVDAYGRWRGSRNFIYAFDDINDNYVWITRLLIRERDLAVWILRFDPPLWTESSL